MTMVSLSVPTAAYRAPWIAVGDDDAEVTLLTSSDVVVRYR